MPWTQIGAPMAAAEDALARLDERLRKSPIRDGWIARTHFSDACAALWLEGTAVSTEDLVLHDAEMDIRLPTQDLAHAHAALRARRRIFAAPAAWALSDAGLAAFRGRAGEAGEGRNAPSVGPDPADGSEDPLDKAEDGDDSGEETGDAPFAAMFAELDAAVRGANRAVAETRGPAAAPGAYGDRNGLVYDLDWDEEFRLAQWRSVVDETQALPPTLAAAIVLEAWTEIAPLQHAAWLGRLLSAALLRERGKTRAHLACLHEGMQKLPYERRRARDPASRLVVQLEAIAAAAETGLKAHDRWMIARAVLMRKLHGRRSSSRLPALLDYVLTRPIVSANMIARELQITPRAAQNLVAELNLREATGRARYRAWGVL